MKTLLLSLIGIVGLTVSAQAEVLGPRTATNVLVGGVAGAIIGEHNNHHAAEGALIGATAGYLWSAATHSPRTVVVERPAVVVAAPPTVIYRQVPSRVVYVTPAPVYWESRRHDRHGRHGRHGHYCR